MKLQFILGIQLILGLTACTPKTAADVTIFAEEVTCAILNAELSDAQINQICNIVEKDTPAVLTILSVHRTKLAMMRHQ